MGDFSSWSLNLGQWRGVRVRLHAFFLLFGVFTLYLSTRGGAGMLELGVESLIVLFFSVLVHEIGHAYAAYRVGGGAEQIVIGPWGGLTVPHVPHEPLHEFITAIAGPVVSLMVCLATVPALFALHEDPLGILLSPLEPPLLVDGAAILKLVLWVNWLLTLVNLLPAFPFDGGRALRSIFWRAFDYRTSVLIVAYYAMVVAGGLALIACLNYKDFFASKPMPVGIPLLLLSIFLFFSAQQEKARLEEREVDDGVSGYDFSQGYTSLERNFDQPHRGPGPIRRWLAHRRQLRRAREQQIEREEESQIDSILARLHEIGRDGLSAKERALLERVSARYRNRQQS